MSHEEGASLLLCSTSLRQQLRGSWQHKLLEVKNKLLRGEWNEAITIEEQELSWRRLGKVETTGVQWSLRQFGVRDRIHFERVGHNTAAFPSQS